MFNPDIYQQLSAMANLLTVEQVLRDTELANCGQNAGYPIHLKDGEIISFPERDKSLFQGKLWKKSKLLWVGVDRGGKAEFLPVWLFRKRPASEKDESLTMRNHALYGLLTQQGQRDIDRVLNHLAGKTFKVKVERLVLLNKEGKEYDFEIYLLEEIISEPVVKPAKKSRK